MTLKKSPLVSKLLASEIIRRWLTATASLLPKARVVSEDYASGWSEVILHFSQISQSRNDGNLTVYLAQTARDAMANMLLAKPKGAANAGRLDALAMLIDGFNKILVYVMEQNHGTEKESGGKA